MDVALKPPLRISSNGLPGPPSRRPVMLAIAGDSASGKTTLAEGLVSILGPERVTVVCTDDYHRYDRAQRAKLGITPLHPECNYVDMVEQHLELLAAGEPILKPVYGHRSGTLEPPEYVRPRDFVIVEGLLPLHSERMRRCFHASVYLDPPEQTRQRWKVRRDCAKRGYEPGQVLAELARREPDSQAFIRPQRARSDVVVRFTPPKRGGDDAHLDVLLVLRPTAPHPDLSSLADIARPMPIRLRLGRDGGRPVDFLEIDGDTPDHTAEAFERVLWQQIASAGGHRPGVGEFRDGTPRRRSHPLALTQLLLVAGLYRSDERVLR